MRGMWERYDVIGETELRENQRSDESAQFAQNHLSFFSVFFYSETQKTTHNFRMLKMNCVRLCLWQYVTVCGSTCISTSKSVSMDECVRACAPAVYVSRLPVWSMRVRVEAHSCNRSRVFCCRYMMCSLVHTFGFVLALSCLTMFGEADTIVARLCAPRLVQERSRCRWWRDKSNQ